MSTIATAGEQLAPHLKRWREQDPTQRKLVYALLKRAMLHSHEAVGNVDGAKAFAAALDVLAFTADGGVT